MAKFTYNNTQNPSIGHTLFEFNCEYHFRISFKDEINPRLRSRFTNKLAEELRELMKICYQNLLYV